MKVCPKCGGRFPAESRFCEFDGQPLIEEHLARPDTQSRSSTDVLRTSPYHRVTQKYCRKCYAFLASDATCCTCGSFDLIEIGKPKVGNVDFDVQAVKKDLREGRYKIAAQKCIDSGFWSMDANFIMANLLICGQVDEMGRDDHAKELECVVARKHINSDFERLGFESECWCLCDNKFLGGNVIRGFAHLQVAMRQGLSLERTMQVVTKFMWKKRFRQAVYLVPIFFKILFIMSKDFVEDEICWCPTGKGLWRQLEYIIEYISSVAIFTLLFASCISLAIMGVVYFLLHTSVSSIILLTVAFLCVVYVGCVIGIGFSRRDYIKHLSFMTSEDPLYEDWQSFIRR